MKQATRSKVEAMTTDVSKQELKLIAMDIEREQMLLLVDSNAAPDLQQLKARCAQWEKELGGPQLPAPSVARPLPPAAAAAPPSSFLSSLTPALQQQLTGFFAKSSIELKALPTTLLYKATRDGFMAADFFRCVAEKGATLTLVKAARTGYVFGAYTAVEWPKPSDEDVNVADPSGRSFLFSLSNKYQRPFRLSLVDSTRAICSPADEDGTGPDFGGSDTEGPDLKFPNFVLMNNGQPADAAKGNCCNTPRDDKAYQLDAWTAENPEPAEFKLDDTTFAGAAFFAAAEIEVYQM